MQTAQKCPVCNGEGKYKGEECHGCYGLGWVTVGQPDYVPYCPPVYPSYPPPIWPQPTTVPWPPAYPTWIICGPGGTYQ